LLFISALSDYFHGRFIESFRGSPKAKYGLISSLIFNIGMLSYFKYADFFINSMNQAFGLEISTLGISLPIGISFFTFQTMSYSIDIYRGEVSAQKNFISFFTYVAMFPQLVAGPIVRYQDISESLDQQRRISLETITYGVQRFILGLAKKILIANQLGEFILAFRNAEALSTLFYWTYALAFTLQIYFDFSGYSDMAIGMGKIFGFSFPENFTYPFCATSITDFWRRWHQTLGRWFRDYVYIPLGGNQKGSGVWVRNLMILWFLTGLWHGAAWNFVLWGLYFGWLLAIEKLLLLKRLLGLPKFLRHLYVLILVSFSFVIFNAEGLGGIIEDTKGLIGFGSLPFYTKETGYQLLNYGMTLLFAMIGATPIVRNTWKVFQKKILLPSAGFIFESFVYLFFLFMITIFLVDQSFNPFIYFRF